jgi:YfiH family protein
MDTITKNDLEKVEHSGFAWRERGGVRALVCTALAKLGFTNAFSTRLGGVSPLPQDALNLAGFADDTAENIAENRRRFLSLLGGEWKLATAWQVHGANVVRVGGDEGYVNDDVRCDALTTDAAGVLVSVKTADCVPVLLADARTGACAAVHAGWRGTLAEILPKTLVQMSENYGTRPEDIHAAIGPAALACCYEVGAEVITAFESRFAETFFTASRDGHALIDLHRANESQLTACGVALEHIHRAPLCTMHRNDLFFSYRREKEIHGRAGRLLAVIGRDVRG